MKFEWDAAKATVNLRKHGVSFEEASTIFFDEDTKVTQDPEHSDEEDRFLAVGFSARQRLLIVVHCHQAADAIIRIISARKLTKMEKRQFEEGL